MDNQIILACDDSGNFKEYIPRMKGHTGGGVRHIGICLLIVNSKGEMLLQKRKHLVFDNIWCFSADTHPLHKENGKDETMDEACTRCMDREYKVSDKINWKNFGEYNYFAKYNQYCENEYCYLMVGEYNGQFSLNPEVGYEYRWVSKTDFLKDFEAKPKNYAPWIPGAVEVLKKSGFFSQLFVD